jgi:HSP20 family molecular chaperone IbpA
VGSGLHHSARNGVRWNWRNIEVSDTDKEVIVTAELPGLQEKDIDVELANGVLSIKGEKRTETEDKADSSGVSR